MSAPARLLPLLLAAACAARAPPRVATATAATATPQPPARFEPAAVDAYVAATVARRHMVGASLTVVRDGATVLSKGYGVRSLGGAPVDPQTIFGIGSVSKQFTCAAAALLADEGKLSMQDPVARYFPSLTRAADITLADLGGHLSGYPDYYPLDFMDARMLAAATPDEIMTRYAGGRLDFEPRTRRSYSNTGYVILGRVVEKASGRPFVGFLAERILGKLGLERTSHDAPKDANLAAGHTAFLLGPAEAARPEEREWMWAAGAMYSTAPDLARWDLALIDGKLLSPTGLAALTRSRTLANGRETGYGCGLGVAQRGGETVLVHTGAVSGYLAYNAFVPRTRSAVVLLLNADHVDGRALFDEIVDLVLADPRAVPPVAGPAAEVAARALFVELQRGAVDRGKLGEAYSAYLAPARLAEAAPRLAALGEPVEVVVEGQHERGGMEVTALRFVFATRTLDGVMFRSTDGKIQQLLVGDQ